MLDEFRGSRPPLRENVGSDRRSPSAGPSDIARLNPIAQVSDTAPQGPDSAPGPSTATHVPPPLGPSHHDAPSGDEYVSPRGRVDEWEHVRYGSRHVSSPERLRDDLDRTHTEISQLRDYIDFCRARGRAPPDHSYRDLDILQSRYHQISLALSELHQAFASSRRGRSPVIASSRVPSPTYAPRPPRPDSSSFRGPRLSPQPGPSSQDRRHPHNASSDLPRHSRLPEEHYRDRFATSADCSDSKRRRSRESPSKRLGVASRGSPSPMRMGFHSRGPLLQREWDSPQGCPPLHSEWDSLQGGPPLQNEWDSPQGCPPLHSEWDSLQGGPLPLSERDSLQGSPLSKATAFRFKGLCFPSTSALITCFVW